MDWPGLSRCIQLLSWGLDDPREETPICQLDTADLNPESHPSQGRILFRFAQTFAYAKYRIELPAHDLL